MAAVELAVGMTRAEALGRLTGPGEAFELVPGESWGRGCRRFKNSPPTLRALFESALSDADFIVYQGERLSFRAAWRRAVRIGWLLHAGFGVRKGDRVAISMRNYPEWALCFNAATSIGAGAVAMNALWQPAELAFGLQDCGAKVLFADQERLDRLAQVRGELPNLAVVAVRPAKPLPPDTLDLAALMRGELAGLVAAPASPLSRPRAESTKPPRGELQGAAANPPAEPAAEATQSPRGAAQGAAAKPLPLSGPQLAELLRDETLETLPEVGLQPEDLATILYTSGSTGHPKGAVSSHLNVLSALMSWELDAAANALVAGVAPPEPPHQQATLLGVPLFHVAGSHAVMLMSYRSQRKLVCMHKWDVAEAQRLIEAERITSFIAPAAMTGDLAQAAPTSRHDLSSLLTVGGGGAPRAPEQVRQIAGAFAQALPNTGWGMTETNAIGTGIGGQDYVDHPGSSGRASAVCDLRVVDASGKALPAGEKGELQIKGVSIIQGYWNRPEANAETFAGDWLRTGDVAYLDADGYLYIVDRIKDLVIRGGENIGCAEVEAGLLEHPQVLEASVYAVPDARLGEEVGASLFCEAGLGEGALRDFLAGRMARFKIPRYLQFCEGPLPRIASGKIDKRRLRESFVAGLGE